MSNPVDLDWDFPGTQEETSCEPNVKAITTTIADTTRLLVQPLMLLASANRFEVGSAGFKAGLLPSFSFTVIGASARRVLVAGSINVAPLAECSAPLDHFGSALPWPPIDQGIAGALRFFAPVPFERSLVIVVRN